MADMWEERFKSGPVDERQKSKALVVKVFKLALSVPVICKGVAILRR